MSLEFVFCTRCCGLSHLHDFIYERMIFMNYLVGIDIGKNSHFFSIMNKSTGEVLLEPVSFNNNKEGFDFLINKLTSYPKDEILIGIEDTGHYHFPILKFLLNHHYHIALINPMTTDLTRKIDDNITKNDKPDTLTICDVITTPQRKKHYRITTIDTYELYEQRQLTRQHHDLKEELNRYYNRLQKSIDLIFPEYNSFFHSKYGTSYINVLKKFPSAEIIAHTDIRALRKCFDIDGMGRRISLTAEQLKEAAKNSIGISSESEEIQVKHLVSQIELINEQINEIDKKIEEFSIQNNSPILSIPGISHFSSTSIISELGDINKYDKPSRIIKRASVAPYHYESSQFNAEHTAITKRGSKYLRKTLHQVIVPVIENNKVFKDYYNLKRAQGKSHRCAQGHCVRKLLRVIYHLLKTNHQLNLSLLQ